MNAWLPALAPLPWKAVYTRTVRELLLVVADHGSYSKWWIQTGWDGQVLQEGIASRLPDAQQAAIAATVNL